MPRSPSLTNEIQEQIVSFIKEGNYFCIACELAGVPKATGNEWLIRGNGNHCNRDDREPFASFAVAVKKAEAEAEQRAIAVIQQSALGRTSLKRKYERDPKTNRMKLVEQTEETKVDWTAAAWYLERKFPDRWAKQKQYELMQMLEYLSAQGLLVPGQAKVISDSVGGIKEGLRSLSTEASQEPPLANDENDR